MYLVVGANGFLGSYIIKNIIEKTNDVIIATARDISAVENSDRLFWVKCDITKKEDVSNLRSKIGNSIVKVIFLASYHKPDEVEKNIRLAWEINIISLAYFINMMDCVECFYYASTDSVYGNSIDKYHFKETDWLSPENTYGIQKKTAESIVLGYGYNVIRFPFLIGKSILKQKKHFYDYIVENVSQGKEFSMFYDSYRSSLDFNTAADVLISIIERYQGKTPKILNISGDEDLSKYDIGLMIADKENISRGYIKAISIFKKDNIFIAQRATSTLMDNSLVKQLLNVDKIRLNLN